MRDEEPYSGTRPYECRSCGGFMRTRGIDGLCIGCYQPAPTRCEMCARVRYAVGGQWEDHPGTVPGERPGFCATCESTREGQREAAYWRGVRRTVRRQRGREPWAEGTTPADVWKGFREGDR